MADSHSAADSVKSETEPSLIRGNRSRVFDKSTSKIILFGK